MHAGSCSWAGVSASSLAWLPCSDTRVRVSSIAGRKWCESMEASSLAQSECAGLLCSRHVSAAARQWNQGYILGILRFGTMDGGERRLEHVNKCRLWALEPPLEAGAHDDVGPELDAAVLDNGVAGTEP